MAQATDSTVTTVGDRVLLTDKKKGECRFVGPLPKKKGVYYGIRLDSAKGKNNGTVNKIFYFDAKDKHGIFVTKDKIKKSKQGEKNGDAPRVTVGSRVNVPSKESEGVVMYIGCTSFKPGPIWYGIKLDKPNGKNNGTVKDRKYFTCKDKYGTFVPANKLEVVEQDGAKTGKKKVKKKEIKKTTLEKKSSKKKKEEVIYSIGDKIMIKPDKKGEIRWIGEEKAFGIGEWYGVRLNEKRGNCDGEYKDVRKFRCEKEFGIYVQKKLIVRKLEENEIDFDYSNEEAKYKEIEQSKQAEINERKKKKKLIRDFFRLADKDGDYDIDRSEWEKMCQQLWPDMAPEEIETLFKSIDVTNSGEISLAEFEGWDGLDDLLNRMKPKNDNDDVNVKTDDNKKDDDSKDEDNKNDADAKVDDAPAADDAPADKDDDADLPGEMAEEMPKDNAGGDADAADNADDNDNGGDGDDDNANDDDANDDNGGDGDDAAPDAAPDAADDGGQDDANDNENDE